MNINHDLRSFSFCQRSIYTKHFQLYHLYFGWENVLNLKFQTLRMAKTKKRHGFIIFYYLLIKVGFQNKLDMHNTLNLNQFANVFKIFNTNSNPIEAFLLFDCNKLILSHCYMVWLSKNIFNIWYYVQQFFYNAIKRIITLLLQDESMVGR